MKKMIALAAAILSTSAMASWEINQNGIAVQMSKNDYTKWVLIEHSQGEVYISLASTSKRLKCESANPVWLVNDTPVKFESICTQGATRSSPQTDKGREFIMNEFKEKSSVKIGSTTYSAVGFNEAVSKVKSWDKKMENAL